MAKHDLDTINKVEGDHSLESIQTIIQYPTTSHSLNERRCDDAILQYAVSAKRPTTTSWTSVRRFYPVKTV